MTPSALRRVVKLVAGRMPAESSPYDVLASFTFQQDYGVHIGSVIHAPLYASSQLSTLSSGAHVAPSGPTVALHVVGIGAAEMEFPSGTTPEYDLFTTPAFARAVNKESCSRPSTSSAFETGRPACPASPPQQTHFTSTMSQIRRLPLLQLQLRSTPRP